MREIINFEDYLNGMSNKIADDALNSNASSEIDSVKYYNTVTKPLFQKLLEITECRLSEIETRVNETCKSVTTQSKLVICEVPVNDLKQYCGIEPVIDINGNVDYVEEKSSVVHFKAFKTVKGNNVKLFSYICNVDYNDFIRITDKSLSAEITDSKGNEHKVNLVQKINTDYIMAEEKIKKLIVSNKICDKFYPIPICRRIIDVYLNECDIDGIKSVSLDKLDGNISVPVWNLSCHSGKTISRRTVSPYSSNSKKNIYVGEIDINDGSVIDCIAETEISDRNFLYSDFTDKKIRIYSADKDSMKSVTLYYINNSEISESLSITDFSVLNIINLDKYSSNYISEGIIAYMVNELSAVTNFEFESVTCKENEVTIKLSKVSDRFCYDHEMKQLITDMLKKYYPRYSFVIKE